MKRFKKICKMSQMDLKKWLAKKLKNTHKNVIFEDGFLYAPGEIPILLVAHLDTVHNDLPSSVFYDKERDVLYSDEGIGGDDRCGVYMILQIIEQYNCSVLFCEDEEIGCKGAEKFVDSPISENLTFNFILEFDRKGSNDAVFYNCGNEDFESFITANFYNKAYGLFSDISVIAPALGCAAANLSCGYYNAHTKNEYVVFGEMVESINAAMKIIACTTEEDVFEYIENKCECGPSSYYCNNFFETDTLYLIECNSEDRPEWDFIYATSKEEAVGKFLINNPEICYNQIDSVVADNQFDSSF